MGVYHRDAQGRPGPDPGVYQRAMTLRHGQALLLADGFDGSRLDAGYEADGEVSVVLGRLVLGPASSVEVALPRLPGPGSGGIVLETVTDRELAVGWEGATLRLSAGAALAVEERVRVRIRPREGDAAGTGQLPAGAHQRLRRAPVGGEPARLHGVSRP